MSSLMAPPVSFSYAPDPEELFPPLPELELLPPEPDELLFPPELFPPALTMAWLIICWICSSVTPDTALEEDVGKAAEDTMRFRILNPSICRI